jgi:hypothetical protein
VILSAEHGAHSAPRSASITLAPYRRRGRVIAAFQSAADARMFVSLKLTEGVDVVAMESADPQFIMCVRLLEPAL